MGQQNSKLKPNDLNDLKHATKFSEGELQDFYKGFKKDCPNGKLSKEGFKKMYCRFYPSGDASLFAEHAFRTFDTDGNGNIDFREFITALSLMSRGTDDEKLRWAFQMYDLDGNGSIQRQEMLEIVTAIHKMGATVAKKMPIDNSTSKPTTPEGIVDKIYQYLGKKKDESITLSEFQAGAKKGDPSVSRFLKLALSTNG